MTSLRLASLIGNQGREVSGILDIVATDAAQRPTYKAEALSLMAARRAISGDSSNMDETIATIESLLPAVDSEAARAKILHHLGIVNRHIGNVRRSFEWLSQSSELATELHFYGLASRTYAVLSNLSLHEEDDVESQRRYAEFAADAATRAGDTFAFETALLQLLSAEVRSGDEEQSLAIERQLAKLQTSSLGSRQITLFRAVRVAWKGQFGEAHRLLSASWDHAAYGIDRACYGAQYALFLALDGRREASIKKIEDVLAILTSLKISRPLW